MGFLNKLLFEEIPRENEQMPNIDYVEEYSVEAELESVNTDTLIDDIYAQNDLMDKSKSIFKVEELINSLPKEMVTATKKASVLAILGSFGLTALAVSEDGENRIKILDEIKTMITHNCGNSITDKENQIEEYKRKIAELEKEISTELETTKTSIESIDKEVNRIDELVRFIGGVE